MYTIKENITNEIVINKSRFITRLVKIKDISLVKDILEDIKEEFKDANHYCYAYIVNNYKKSSDDGEPGGTAGVPIMEVLNKSNLDYVFCVVIRYFGGIKLGAGGLIRAYSKSVSNTLEKALKKELINGYKIVLSISYEKQKSFETLISGCGYKAIYEDYITYTIEIPIELYHIIDKTYKITSKENIIIEK